MRIIQHIWWYLVFFLSHISIARRGATLELSLRFSKSVDVFVHQKEKIVDLLEKPYVRVVDGKGHEGSAGQEKEGNLQEGEEDAKWDSKMINVYLYFIYKMNSPSSESFDSSLEPASPTKNNPNFTFGQNSIPK